MLRRSLATVNICQSHVRRTASLQRCDPVKLSNRGRTPGCIVTLKHVCQDMRQLMARPAHSRVGVVVQVAEECMYPRLSECAFEHPVHHLLFPRTEGFVEKGRAPWPSPRSYRDSEPFFRAQRLPKNWQLCRRVPQLSRG